VGTFQNLSAHREFCEALGRMTLSAARLESDMRTFLALNDIPVPPNATFGALAAKLKQNGLLSENGEDMLRTLKTQRNYLTHSLYDLFAARIGEGLMLREELEDASLLADRAFVLEENLSGLAQTAEKRISQLLKGDQEPGGLLFTP